MQLQESYVRFSNVVNLDFEFPFLSMSTSLMKAKAKICKLEKNWLLYNVRFSNVVNLDFDFPFFSMSTCFDPLRR